MGALIYLTIILAIIVVALMAFIFGKRFVKLGEKGINKQAYQSALYITNEGTSVDKVLDDIKEINKNTQIPFNIKGRIK